MNKLALVAILCLSACVSHEEVQVETQEVSLAPDVFVWVRVFSNGTEVACGHTELDVYVEDIEPPELVYCASAVAPSSVGTAVFKYNATGLGSPHDVFVGGIPHTVAWTTYEDQIGQAWRFVSHVK